MLEGEWRGDGFGSGDALAGDGTALERVVHADNNRALVALPVGF